MELVGDELGLIVKQVKKIQVISYDKIVFETILLSGD